MYQDSKSTCITIVLLIKVNLLLGNALIAVDVVVCYKTPYSMFYPVRVRTMKGLA